jgi:CRISPR-associated protein (TIGR03984 family)
MASIQQAGGEYRHWSVLFGGNGPVVEADESVVRNYPFTGFVLMRDMDRLSPPPGVDPARFGDWSLFWDLRLFGDLGEWHLWREDDGKWTGRLAEATDPSWKDSIPRVDVLWGSRNLSQEHDGVQWILYSEKRGAAVWVPHTNLQMKRFARLHLWQRVHYDSHTGLAGVVDSMLRNIESTEGQHA